MFARLRLLALVVGLLSIIAIAAACDSDDDDDADHEEAPTAAFELDAETALHHWQALAAIRDDELDDATHHVEHVIAVVDGEHLVAMREVLDQLGAGELHDAEHGIETMLVGRADPGVTTGALHLQMALAAIEEEADDDARHHLEHAMATATGDEAAELDEALEHMLAGEHHEAEERITALLTALAPADDHDDDDHDADDDHEAVDAEGARTITVVMREFAFDPDEIHAQVGETVRLLLVNEGVALHDITAEEFHGDAEAIGSESHSDSTVGEGHDDGGAFHAAANAGETVELVFVAEEAGEFPLFCSVPGHRELGMTATLVVEP